MIKRSIVPKRNLKKMMSTLLPIVKEVVKNQINKIKSSIMHKILSNKKKKYFEKCIYKREKIFK